MTATMTWQIVDGTQLTKDLAATREQIPAAEGELFLDFSAVHRLNPAGLHALEELAQAAEEKSVKVVLRGVDVAVYKVLKLARLASRFALVN